MRDETVSNMYQEIVAANRNMTNKDVLIELLQKLGQLPNWSRGALADALSTSNLHQIMRKWIEQYPPPVAPVWKPTLVFRRQVIERLCLGDPDAFVAQLFNSDSDGQTKWNLIKQSMTSPLNGLDALFRYLVDQRAVSEKAVVTALQQSHNEAVAKLFLLTQSEPQQGPVPIQTMSNHQKFESLSRGTIICWLTQQLSLHENTRLKLVYQDVDGAFLYNEFARGTLSDTLRAPPFSFPFTTAAHITSLVEKAIDGTVTVELGSRLIDLSTDQRARIVHLLSNAGNDIVIGMGYIVGDYLKAANCVKESAELIARIREHSTTPADKAMLVINMITAAVPRTTMLQFKQFLIEVGRPDLAQNPIFSESPQKNPSFEQGSPMRPTQFSATPVSSAPLLQTMEQRNAVQNMTAAQLLQQTADADLEDLVNQLWSALRRDEAWHKYAATMGATASDEAKEFIKAARVGGRPERAVVAQISQKPGYTALTMLADLKKLGLKSLTECVESIENHLACRESAATAKTVEADKNEDVLRQWIVNHRLCASTADVDTCVEGLKRFGAHTLEDLEIMDKEDFIACKFPGLAAKKAQKAPKTLEVKNK